MNYKIYAIQDSENVKKEEADVVIQIVTQNEGKEIYLKIVENKIGNCEDKYILLNPPEVSEYDY